MHSHETLEDSAGRLNTDPVSRGAGFTTCAEALLLGMCVLVPWLAGGAYIVTWPIFSIATAAALCLRSMGALLDRQALHARLWPLVLLTTAALVAPLLQVWPIKCAWVQALAPFSYQAQLATSDTLRSALDTCTLSLAPAKTWSAVHWGVVIVGAYLITANRRSRLLSKQIVSRTLGYNLTAVASVACLHALLELDAPFGLDLLRPEVRDRVLGPFLNPNHLAAYLLLALPSVAARLGARARRRHLALTLCTLLLATLCLGATGSLGSMALAVAISLVLWRPRRRYTPQQARNLRAAGIMTMLGASAWVGALGWQPIASAFDAKLRTIRIGLDAVWEQPLVGLGRFAFRDYFPAVAHREYHFTHPENFIAQWLSEAGVLLGLALTGGVLWTMLALLRPVFRNYERHSARHTLALSLGTLALLLHDAADFALELPGMALLACTTATLSLCARPQDVPPAATRSRRGAALGLCAGIALLICACFALHTSPPQHAVQSTRRLRQRRLTSAVLRRNPNDARLFLYASAKQFEPGAVAWAQRSAILAPTWEASIRAEFHAAWRQKQSQALTRALARPPKLVRAPSLRKELCKVARAVRDHEQTTLLFEAIAGVGSPGAQGWAESVIECMRPTQLRRLLVRRFVTRFPDSVPLQQQRLDHWLHSGFTRQAAHFSRAFWQRLPSQQARLLLYVDTVRRMAPESRTDNQLVRDLRAPSKTATPELLLAIARFHMSRRSWQDADKVLERAAAQDTHGKSLRAEAVTLRADVAMARHKGRLALKLGRHAFELASSPARARLLLRLAKASNSREDHVRACDYLLEGGHESDCDIASP